MTILESATCARPLQQTCVRKGLQVLLELCQSQKLTHEPITRRISKSYQTRLGLDRMLNISGDRFGDFRETAKTSTKQLRSERQHKPVLAREREAR